MGVRMGCGSEDEVRCGSENEVRCGGEGELSEMRIR